MTKFANPYTSSRGSRKDSHRPTYVNEKIKAFNIIVIDEEGNRLGVMPRRKALGLAQEKGLDLVQVAYNPREKVSTAKIVDLGKYLYEKKKKQKEKRKNQQAKGVKQIKMSYAIGENDLLLKIDKAKEMLDEGYKVKIIFKMKGRQKVYKNKVIERLKIIQEDMESHAKSQYPYPKEERNGYAIILIPTK